MKINLVQIYQGPGKFVFNGFDNIIIRITKETKNKFYGFDTKLRGNQGRESYKGIDYEKIVINKNLVQGWKYF